MTAPDEHVLVLDEPDYRYGVGMLRIRVERIDRASPIRYDGDLWYTVDGMQLDPSGAELGHRQILAPARRIRPWLDANAATPGA